ncbi:MAG: DUF444 family protein, partial [Bacteroidales bacterium]|nr:DUF444 family protein [Bacteroidales bacterium]
MINENKHKENQNRERESNSRKNHFYPKNDLLPKAIPNVYSLMDGEHISGFSPAKVDVVNFFATLDELLKRDEQREKDGFSRRIRLGKIFKSTENSKNKVIVVPTTSEPKFYHDDSMSLEDGDVDQTGGKGEGDPGEVIGEQDVDADEGTGQGAGKGQGGEHESGSEAFDLGKILTEQFELPDLVEKGSKRSFTNYVYDLTDKNRRFGQLLDKKATLKRLIETNILLGRIKPEGDFNVEDFLISPDDHVYRILSKEKAFEAQAMVFFLRDYSSSMNGSPTEVVTSQHLLIYSWLMYQYKNRVET